MKEVVVGDGRFTESEDVSGTSVTNSNSRKKEQPSMFYIKEGDLNPVIDNFTSLKLKDMTRKCKLDKIINCGRVKN